ncbi:hypothetical protein DNTS_023470 [Danionella cerebrum]|uniref:Uncharacterized protein n=1 Tax=Danionella cerebrum TaxID=2873325 RepID=A0A553MWE3_9TELE|nr:hypothetical protein DNTS_023470 [Danionella translucida]
MSFQSKLWLRNNPQQVVQEKPAQRSNDGLSSTSAGIYSASPVRWKKKKRKKKKRQKRTKQPQDFTSTSSTCQLSPREKTALTTF